MIRAGGNLPSGVFDASRHQLTGDELERLCPPGPSFDEETSRFSSNHLQLHLLHQPGSRIADFHLIVGAGYLGLAALALVAVRLLVRRTKLSAG